MLTFVGKEANVMKYSVDKEDKYAVFSLEEENLNSLMAPKLKSELVILNNEGVPNLILDLSKVEFVDSSGLSSILTGNRLWQDEGLFILTGIKSPNVKRLIEISRLDGILTIIPTLQESVDYVIMQEIENELKGEDEGEEPS